MSWFDDFCDFVSDTCDSVSETIVNDLLVCPDFCYQKCP